MPSRSSSAVAAVPRPATLRSLATHASRHWIGRAANPGDGYDRRGAESTWRHMRPLIVEVPSPLGLRPSAWEMTPELLRTAGLHSLLGCDDAQHVAVPAYDARRDEATGVLNPDGIAEVARSLAGVVDSALQADRLPVVLGGDCSIVLGPLLALRRRGRRAGRLPGLRRQRPFSQRACPGQRHHRTRLPGSARRRHPARS